MATAGLVLGILSLVLSMVTFLNLILATLGLIFSIIAYRQGYRRGKATGGLVCSIVGFCLALLTLLAIFASLSSISYFGNYPGDYANYAYLFFR